MKEKDSGQAEMETQNIPADESLDSVLDKLNSAIKVSDCTDYAASRTTKISEEESGNTDGEASKGNRESNFLQDYLDDRDEFSFLVLSGMKTPNPTPKTSVVSNPVSDGLFAGLVDKVDRTISEERVEEDEILNENELQGNELPNGAISNEMISEGKTSAKQRNRKNTVIDGVLSDGSVKSIGSERNTPLTNDPGIDSVGQIVEIDSSTDQICKDKQESNSHPIPEDNNSKQAPDISDVDDASLPDLEIVDESSQLQPSKKDCDIVMGESVVMENICVLEENTNSKVVSRDSPNENQSVKDTDANCIVNQINDILPKDTKEENEIIIQSTTDPESKQKFQEKINPTISNEKNEGLNEENYLNNISNENEDINKEQILSNNKDELNKSAILEVITNVGELVQDSLPKLSDCIPNDGENQNDIPKDLKATELSDNKELASNDNGSEDFDVLNVNDASLPDLENVDTMSQNTTEVNSEIKSSKQESSVICRKEKTMENIAGDINQSGGTNTKTVSKDVPIENNVLNDTNKNINKDENKDVNKERLISFFESKNMQKIKNSTSRSTSRSSSRSTKKKAQRRDTKLLMLDNKEGTESSDNFESSFEKANDEPHTEQINFQ